MVDPVDRFRTVGSEMAQTINDLFDVMCDATKQVTEHEQRVHMVGCMLEFEHCLVSTVCEVQRVREAYRHEVEEEMQRFAEAVRRDIDTLPEAA